MKTVLQISLGIILLFFTVVNGVGAWSNYQKNKTFVKATVVECYRDKDYLCDYRTSDGIKTKSLSRQEWRETGKLTGKELDINFPVKTSSIVVYILFGLVSLVGFLVCIIFAVLPNIPNNEDYYI